MAKTIRLINQQEIVIEFGGMTTKDILRWVQAGRFPCPLKIIGRYRLFDRDEVVKFLLEDRRSRQSHVESLAALEAERQARYQSSMT